MKKFRKIMAVLVAAVLMISSFTLTAFAAVPSSPYKIIIANGVDGQTYTAYKVFDLTLHDRDDDDTIDSDDAYAYSILRTSEFWSVLTTGATHTGSAGNNDKYVNDTYGLTLEETTVSGKYNVIFNDTLSVAKVQALAAALGAVEEKPTGYSITYSDGAANEINVTTPGLGYYLVDSSQGVLCSLDSTTTNVTIYEKNTEPTIHKYVEEDLTTITVGGVTSKANDPSTVTDTTAQWFSLASADIGQSVRFKILVNTGAYKNYADNTSDEDEDDLGTGVAADYVIEDQLPSGKMSYRGQTCASGTTWSTAVATTRDSDNVVVSNDGSAWAIGTDYTVTYENAKITITLKKAKLATLNINEDIEIYYGAVVDNEAVIGGAGNPNQATLKYAGDSGAVYQKQSEIPVVYVSAAALYKYNEEGQPLSGARFTMKTPEGTAMYFVKTVSGTATAPTIYRYSTENTDANETYLETPASGSIVIYGLDTGTYTATETLAPNGYNWQTADNSVPVVYAASIEAAATTKEFETNTGETATFTFGTTDKNGSTQYAIEKENSVVGIENQHTVELPSTGGMGTTVLYIVGGMLVILAGAYLFFSRKKTA